MYMPRCCHICYPSPSKKDCCMTDPRCQVIHHSLACCKGCSWLVLKWLCHNQMFLLSSVLPEPHKQPPPSSFNHTINTASEYNSQRWEEERSHPRHVIYPLSLDSAVTAYTQNCFHQLQEANCCSLTCKSQLTEEIETRFFSRFPESHLSEVRGEGHQSGFSD